MQRGWIQLRMTLVMLQIVGILIATVAALMEIESIVASGPLLTLNGLLIAVVGYRRRRPPAFYFGLYAPSVSLICFLIIFFNRWGPSAAARPIGALVALLAFVGIPLGVYALVSLSGDCFQVERRGRQFGIASLFGLTTVVALPFGLNSTFGVDGLVLGITISYAAVVGYFLRSLRPKQIRTPRSLDARLALSEDAPADA
jgi:hypothetical protein